jgi:uncharacterized repeat protein (TIGR01451 family)
VGTLFLGLAVTTAQPLDESCTATILNRSVQVSPFGTFAIPNVPVEPGFFRVRITCMKDGVTTVGQSGYIMLNRSGVTQIPSITLGVQDPMPVGLTLAAPQTTFTAANESVQFMATASFADGSTENVTPASEGTFWSSSNPQIARVEGDGLVTAVSRGAAIIQASNEGVLASLAIQILIPDDADGDGLTDAYEQVYGFDPNDPADALQDADGDGLTNLRESELGTNPRNSDTDGDGVTDTVEIAQGSNPNRADSDGDGLNDGQELALGLDPNHPDTDGDGIPDALELRLGLNAAEPDATTTVRGRMLDGAGDPLADASAVVLEVLTARSDADGFFTLPSVPAEQGNLTILAQLIRGNQVLEGRATGVAPVPGGVTDIGSLTLTLNAGVVAGEIRNPLGQPVVDAQVTVVAGTDTRNTRTDGEGRYRVDNMTAGALTVTARDYRTGLRGRSPGNLPLNASTSVDVTLGAFGSVRGTVFSEDGLTPVGPGVAVTISGATRETTVTDALGRYLFEFVRLGAFTVEAMDTAGQRGRNTGNVATTGRTVVADLTYLGSGTVNGLVFTGSGAPATDVDVTLNSRSVFNGRASQNTGSGNAFEFDPVFLGPFDVTAVSTSSRLAGTATGAVDIEGQVVAVEVQLTSAGAFEGTVFLADGLTPVPGAEVGLSPTGLQAITDDQGRYRFDFIPLGTYTFEATDPATGDRGRSTGTLAAQDQVQTVNVNLTGFGSIRVLVRDGAGALVPGARVTTTSAGPFAFTQTGQTDADGVALFGAFRAGNFTVTAVNQATGLSGAATGSVAAGGSAELTVQLQSAGGINGLVLAPDGATPVPGFSVRLSGPTSRQTLSGEGGAFGYVNLPLGTYALRAVDGAGRIRAMADGLVLASEGQALTRDLVITGAMDDDGNIVFGGIVQGRVTFAEGGAAGNLPVTLSSAAGGGFFTRTDVNGDYLIGQVPPGEVTVRVSTRIGNDSVFGSATGVLPAHDVALLLNVALDRLFDPPSTVRRDANDLLVDIGGDGSVRSGTQNAFVGPGANRGGALLEVVVDATTYRFTGDGFGTFEEGDREIVIHQADLGGLEVTRKVYVAADGYFARYLELFTNPSGARITVDARLLSYFRFITRVEGGFTFQREPRVVATSSGDDQFQVDPERDRWVVIDDDRDDDPFTSNTLPPTAHLFDGVGAPVQAAQLDYAIDFNTRFGRLVEEWESLTLDPGETIGLMHFVVQQSGRPAALASAQRLAQLPPEALAGLSAAERVAIVNFDVPLDGTSPLPPLPPLVGTIDGQVYAHDGTLVVPSARVNFQSESPYYARTRQLTANSSGEFAFTGIIRPGGGSLPIPVAGFQLVATDPPTGFASPATPGRFEVGLLNATQDILFSNSGTVAGEIRRASGEVVTTGSVSLSGGGLLNPISTSPAGDGSYRFRVVPPGDTTVTAALPIPNGTALGASAVVQVNAGQSTVVDLVFPATGEVMGIVRNGAGGPAVNLPVFLQGPGFQRLATTGTGGQYGFTDVPVGDYTVLANEPNTGVPASAPVSVVMDTVTTQDLMLIGLGILEVEAQYTSGPPVASGQVTLQEDARGTNFRNVGVTGANGRLTVRNVTLGDFLLRVHHPVNGTLFGEATGNVAGHGQVIDVAVQVPVDAPPAVTLTAPLAGQSFLEGALINLAANASDDLGVQRVEFLVNDAPVGTDLTAPFGLLYTIPQVTADTALTVVARAVDTGGNASFSPPVGITARNDTTPPTVNLVAPTSGQRFLEGDTITLQATAFDNTSVARVEFAAAGEVLGSDTASPYFWSYRVPDDYAADGSRELVLSARAFDPSGSSAFAEVTVFIDPFDQPSLSIGDVPLAEGNVGLRHAEFTLELSASTTRTVSVRYATADGTATAGEDYLHREGTLTFNPGETTKLILVPILGETVVEEDETFLVNLFEVTNAELTDGQGLGTIVDDDGIPGQLHRFAFGAVASPQFVNQPFDVTVTALDAAGDPVLDYDGTPALRGVQGELITRTVLPNPVHLFSYVSTVTVGYAFTPDTDLTVTHVRHYFGTKVSIWADDGNLLASQNVASTPGNWRETPLASPLTLRAGTRYRLAAHSGGSTVFYRLDGSTPFADGTIQQSHYRSGDGFPSSSDSARWYLVDLRYTVGAQVPVSPTSLAGFVNGVWSGPVTVSQPAADLRLTVDDGDGHIGQSDPFTAEVRNDVSVALAADPDPVDLGQELTYVATVHNSGPGDATGVALELELPVGLAILSTASTHGTPVVESGQVRCDIGTLGDSENATVTVVVGPGVDGLLTATATVTQLSGDTFPDNNVARATTCVNGPPARAFRISGLAATGAVVVEHGPVTGDDRSALAVGKRRVLYTGDTSTASFATADLAGGTALGMHLEALISDLRTGTIYTFANNGAPLGQGGTADSLLPIDEQTGALLGPVRRELWTGIAGTAVADIPLQTPPSRTDQLTRLESPAFGDLYGLRLSARLVAPAAGAYTFWVAGDDNCELWLSTDESPANKNLIATVPGWTNLREWNKYSAQKSAPIELAADTVYYVEALLKEHSGGDHVSVGWARPGDGTTAPSEVIPFSVLRAPTGPLEIGPAPVTLSESLALNFGSGLFAGYGRVVVHNGARVYEATVPEGQVTDWGAMTAPPHTSSEGWAYWGVAEHSPDGVALVYVQNAQTIARTLVPTGPTIALARFSNLSDMAVLSALPSRERWYFHHEGTSQFRSGDETTGFADASFLLDLAGEPDDVGLAASSDPAEGVVDAPLTFTVTVRNAGPGDATAVVVENQLPAAAAFGSATPSQGTASRVGNTLTWEVGDLAGSASATLALELTPTAAGVATLTSSVRRGEPDFYLPNNDLTTSVPVVLPSLRVDDVAVLEGDSGETAAGFTVSLSAAVNRTVQVNYSTSGGSAQSGVDFLPTNGVLTFDPGVRSRSVTVMVLGDELNELDETFALFLSNPVNAVLADNQGVGTILNDDPPPGLAIADVSLIEPNLGIQNLTFEVTLSAPSGLQVRVNYATADGTATSPADYHARSGQLVFNPGQTSQTIDLPIVGEVEPESDETFTVTLSNPVNAALTTAQATGTIVDNDSAAGQLHHFVVGAIPTPQYAGEPFTVSVSARDAADQLVTTYDGAPSLAAFDEGSGQHGNLLANAASPNSSSGNYTLGYSFTPNVELEVTHVRHYFGTKVTIWRDDGTVVTSQAVVSTPGLWIETPLATPVVLQAHTRYRIAAYTGPGSYYWRFDLPALFAHGTLDQGYERSEDGFPTTLDNVRWWFVDLAYRIGRPLPTTPMTLSGFAGGIWTGPVSVGEPGNSVVLTVNDGDGHIGESNPFALGLRNDLALAGTAQPANPVVGAEQAYEFTVANSGPANASGVSALVQLSPYTYFVSADSTQGSSTHQNGTVTFTLGTLAGGASANFSVVVRVAGDGSLISSASVSRSEPEFYLANNTATLTTTVPGLDSFQIVSLGTEGVLVTDHNNLTGDDRGGIALSPLNLFYTGDSATARFPLDTFPNGGVSLGTRHDSLMADLRTGQVYLLGEGNTPVATGGATVTSLLEVDGATGGLTGGSVPLSAPIFAPNGSGLFAGYGRILIHNGSAVFEISLPGGEVTNLGAMAMPPHTSSENWAFWGVAEHLGAERWLTYVQNSQAIVRSRVPDGELTAVASFSNLSDMAAFTVAPHLDRWFFHHEGGSQFGSGSEIVGCASAQFQVSTLGLTDDLLVTLTDAPDPVGVGSPLTYTVQVANTGPSTASNVQLTDTLPAGVEFVSATSSVGTCQEDGGIVTCDLGDLAEGAQAIVTIVVVPLDAGVLLENVAQVTRGEPDFYLPNNTATARTQVITPTLSIADVEVVEGNEGQTDAVFTVTLSAPTSQVVQVRYETSGESGATAGVDFEYTQGLLEFAPFETTRQIIVPVFGDELFEYDEYLDLYLYDLVNAESNDTYAYGGILNDDAPPTLTVSDASVIEGNVGARSLEFAVHLSTASGVATGLYYETEDLEAIASQDYLAASRYFEIPRGETAASIQITVLGDTEAEPDETFRLLLSADGAELAQSEAIGTILDDDSAPGQIHHFVFDPVASPQEAGVPFTVTVTALDAFDDPVTSYDGTPALSAVDQGSGETANLLGSPAQPNSGNGFFTLGYAFTPNVDLVVTHFRHFFGTKVSLWRDDGTLVASAPVASVPGTWVETALASPVALAGGNRYRLAAFSNEGPYHWRFDLPVTFPHGTLDEGYEIFGDAFPTSPDGVRWWYVDLVYTAGMPLPVEPVTLTGFANGIWTGEVTLGAAGAEVTLRADDGDGHTGTSAPFEVQGEDLGGPKLIPLRILGISVGPAEAVDEVRVASSGVSHAVVTLLGEASTARSFVVETSDNLREWQVHPASIQARGAGQFEVTVQVPIGPQAFFRLRAVPPR